MGVGDCKQTSERWQIWPPGSSSSSRFLPDFRSPALSADRRPPLPCPIPFPLPPPCRRPSWSISTGSSPAGKSWPSESADALCGQLAAAYTTRDERPPRSAARPGDFRAARRHWPTGLGRTPTGPRSAGVGLIVLGEPAPKADANLPLDFTDRELLLACRLVGEIVRPAPPLARRRTQQPRVGPAGRGRSADRPGQSPGLGCRSPRSLPPGAVGGSGGLPGDFRRRSVQSGQRRPRIHDRRRGPGRDRARAGRPAADRRFAGPTGRRRVRRLAGRHVRSGPARWRLSIGCDRPSATTWRPGSVSSYR